MEQTKLFRFLGFVNSLRVCRTSHFTIIKKMLHPMLCVLLLPVVVVLSQQYTSSVLNNFVATYTSNRYMSSTSLPIYTTSTSNFVNIMMGFTFYNDDDLSNVPPRMRIVMSVISKGLYTQQHYATPSVMILHANGLTPITRFNTSRTEYVKIMFGNTTCSDELQSYLGEPSMNQPTCRNVNQVFWDAFTQYEMRIRELSQYGQITTPLNFIVYSKNVNLGTFNTLIAKKIDKNEEVTSCLFGNTFGTTIKGNDFYFKIGEYHYNATHNVYYGNVTFTINSNRSSLIPSTCHTQTDFTSMVTTAKFVFDVESRLFSTSDASCTDLIPTNETRCKLCPHMDSFEFNFYIGGNCSSVNSTYLVRAVYTAVNYKFDVLNRSVAVPPSPVFYSKRATTTVTMDVSSTLGVVTGAIMFVFVATMVGLVLMGKRVHEQKDFIAMTTTEEA